MTEFGDIRLVDWRTCGHHPRFPLRPWACVERLEGPIQEIDEEHRLPNDELTEKGWGHWSFVGLLGPDSIERLAESIRHFQETVT